jgi:branched-subunit amino acid aminotransferase/4-amino-4-deoxychorismate lyase
MDLLVMDGQEVTALDWALIGEAGFFTGCRVMTTMLARGPWIVDFCRHMARLSEHGESMNLGALPRVETMKFEIDALIKKLKAPELCRIRVLVFKDKSGLQHRLISVGTTDASQARQRQERGVKLMLTSDKSWARGGHVKTGLLGPRGAQLDRAQAAGYDDILWANGDGEIAEATWANVFFIGRSGDLVEIATPPEATGILAGITRGRIIGLLNSAKIPVTERIISQEEIPGFDEAFLTSSISGLVPVNQIGKHRLHSLRGQAVFHHVATLYGNWLSRGLSNESQDSPDSGNDNNLDKLSRDYLS